VSSKTWKEAVEKIRPILGNATSSQQSLIVYLGVEISRDLPRLVVAAKLRDHLAENLALPSIVEPSSRFIALIEILKKHDENIKPQSASEAEAWVNHLSLLRRVEHLERIKIEAGDIVEIPTEGRFAEVSSIGDEGRVYFKGGHGAGSWPDLLNVCARHTENSPNALELREKARNCAAKIAPTGLWSGAKHRELAEYETKDFITDVDIDRLEQIICTSNDEKSIQKHIEDNPHIITALLGGQNKYCIPQKRLGAEYVPDFLISDTNSLGINWVLIELETPKSPIYLKTTNQLDKYARKGVSQIQEWREWLTSNIAYARNKRKDNGLGLLDIRPHCRAVVLVGRRVYLRETKEVERNQFRDNSNIDIHTYDWLIDTLRSALAFRGPTGLNPHLFQPENI
jgi:hypothetical protein